jgi:hypothetical protein
VYWFLTGHITGLSLALVAHALVAQSSDYFLIAIVLFVFGTGSLWAAADLETMVPEWKKQIAARIASGQLRRWSCFLLGLAFGLPVYVSQWFLWISVANEPGPIGFARILFAGVSMVISIAVGWYLLTCRPRPRA